MSVFLSLAFIFIVGCILGWIIELLFRRIVHKTWINPGFLKGPYLPLYGFGLTALYGVGMIPFQNVIQEQWIIIIIRIVLVAVLMTLLELIAGLIFIKGMNIKLWDYSDRWGNFKGIICPLFSFFWAVIGAVYVILIHPLIVEGVTWFTNNIYFSFFVGIVFGLMIFDLIISLDVGFKLKHYADEYKVVVKFEALKASVKKKALLRKEKFNFISPFKHFNKTMESVDENKEDFSEKK